ncbi:MAG TPA: hypothetical protein DD400_00725 [Rhodospirillaceae bacterium]|nr:hypothetical protein [Rhodospirillaceae bacterium]
MTSSSNKNSPKCLQTLTVGDKAYIYYSLSAASETLGDIKSLPCCIRVLLENLLWQEEKFKTATEDMQTLCTFYAMKKRAPRLTFRPTRLFMTGEDAVSALTDIATLRDELNKQAPENEKIELPCPLDIIIDKTDKNFPLAQERIDFLRWGEKALPPIRIVPPEKGTSSPINLDYLCDIIHLEKTPDNSSPLIVSSTALGSNQSLSMLGALGCLSWKSNVFDIETALLKGNFSSVTPNVIGVKITGKVKKTVSTTDIGITLINKLAQEKVRGKFIEFFGPSVDQLTVPDRAIIANLVSKTKALGSFFPIDAAVLSHLTMIGKPAEHIELVETYAKEQGLWRDSWPHDAQQVPTFSSTIDLSLGNLRPGVSGLEGPTSFTNLLDVPEAFSKKVPSSSSSAPLDTLRHGDIVWAEISACSTVHPKELVAAGLLARKAQAMGFTLKPWVRGTLSLGAPHIHAFLDSLKLFDDLKALGFSIEKKELSDKAKATLSEKKALLVSLQSGPDDDNPVATLEGLALTAAPLLVVAFGLIGSLLHDSAITEIGKSPQGAPVFLKDIWPTETEIRDALKKASSLEILYQEQRKSLFTPPAAWEPLAIENQHLFPWRENSAIITPSPLVTTPEKGANKLKDFKEAQLLALLGDNVAAASICPQGTITPDSPAGLHLLSLAVPRERLGSFDFYTGNSEIMQRGAFMGSAVINTLVTDSETGKTVHSPSGKVLPFFEAAALYHEKKTPLVIAAGKNFGHGPKQEWAAKILRLLGIRAILAESFAPDYRLSLLRVGILPLQFKQGVSMETLAFKIEDKISVIGLKEITRFPSEVMATFEQTKDISRYMLLCAVRDEKELSLLEKGGLWSAYLDKITL